MKTKRPQWVAAVVAACTSAGFLIIAGCSSASVARHEPSIEDWTKAVALPGPGGSVQTPLPPAVADAGGVLEEAGIVFDQPSLPTQIISDLELADEAEVATILRALAKAADINMLISPEVSGTMRFAFRNIPWDQAFRSVVNGAGLSWDWEGNVLRVMTLNDVKRGLEMETLIKQREDVRAEKRRIEPMAIQVIPVKYAEAVAVGATVKSLLVAEAAKAGVVDTATRSTVSIDAENNAIIVHAIPDEISKAIALVKQLDKPKPQVHIEARIVEASRDTARQLGIQWGGTYATVNGQRLVTAGGSSETAGGYNSDFPALFAQGTVPPAGFSLGLISEKIGGSELLNMQLTALQNKGRIQILSSPSITTLDNQKALIESGEERAYRKTTGTGNEADVTVEWKKAVLKLEVTPHVVDDELLRVKISANKDSFDETKQQSNNEYPVNTKKAETSVLLRNGETVVIGGLSFESKSSSESGIPYLMDIPGIGALFRNNGSAKKFDETLIFITPKIITAQP